MLGGCGVVTAVIVAAIGLLGEGNGTTPHASGTSPQDDQAPRTSAEQSATRGRSAASGLDRLWSGGYELRSGMNLELDESGVPLAKKGAANEIWMENLGVEGHVVYTEGLLAPWDVARAPTAEQCRRAIDVGQTTQLQVTVDDRGRGVCVRSTDGDRYAYFGLSTIDGYGVAGSAIVWTTAPEPPSGG